MCPSCSGSQRISSCGECLLQGSAADVAEEGDGRMEKLSQLEVQINRVMDLIDAVDAGHITLPKPCRELALRLAKDTHSWLLTGPATEELLPKVKYVEEVMAKVTAKINRK